MDMTTLFIRSGRMPVTIFKQGIVVGLWSAVWSTLHGLLWLFRAKLTPDHFMLLRVLTLVIGGSGVSAWLFMLAVRESKRKERTSALATTTPSAEDDKATPGTSRIA